MSITKNSWINWNFSFPTGTSIPAKKSSIQTYVNNYIVSLEKQGVYKNITPVFVWSNEYVIDQNTVGIDLTVNITYDLGPMDSNTGPTPPPPPKPAA
jgi:hypothetical protein